MPSPLAAFTFRSASALIASLRTDALSPLMIASASAAASASSGSSGECPRP